MALSPQQLTHRYQRILESMSEGVYGLDANGHATFVNPAAERLTGWSQEEIQGQSIHQFHHHSHADGSHYPHEDCPIYQTLITGDSAHRDNEVFWRKDGNCFAVEYSSTAIIEDGEITGAVVVFKDITERLQQQRSLQAALQQVQQLKQHLQSENRYLQEELQQQKTSTELLGQSEPMHQLEEAIRQVAPTPSCVLIQGESGTGKELVAEAVHRLSQRSQRTLVKVNCGALSDTLLESELFGHERGAFTGAHQRRAGRFEQADGGTLFLDEVGELSAAAQVKLLRVLQNGELQRLGSESTLKVDVRVIAATHRDLTAMVRDGLFRADLYFRLNVFPLQVAPLRERRSDIPLLIQHYLQRLARRLNKPMPTLTPAQLRQLMHYHWPGNVRELVNVLEHALILGQHELRLPALSSDISPEQTSARPLSMMDAERRHILHALDYCQGVVGGKQGAAALLELPESTLRSRMKKLGIR
ncbi:Fis family transcriptional regulator [Bacterioplanes sanyensis]|uniref:Fis family transcriptional regulator n=1 Tax=Bacterioplanes sanyensis TaxID=1249553 RepID=A0A222FLB1_9GAMM|nr:sigma 54-interacting transcriptional regulator [Bacterioplanes sanyensis]ASP39161.1 Fis family transcriptional regulator [Bacterioplanes sanyensis]